VTLINGSARRTLAASPANRCNRRPTPACTGREPLLYCAPRLLALRARSAPVKLESLGGREVRSQRMRERERAPLYHFRAYRHAERRKKEFAITAFVRWRAGTRISYAMCDRPLPSSTCARSSDDFAQPILVGKPTRIPSSQRMVRGNRQHARSSQGATASKPRALRGANALGAHTPSPQP
jgi:hypothetical protein